MVDTKDYYHELHAASRHYDTKLWAIPGIVFVLNGFLLQLVFENLNNALAPLLLGANTLITFIFWLYLEKERFWQLVLQDEIDRIHGSSDQIDKSKKKDDCDNCLKRPIGMYSMSPEQIERWILKIDTMYKNERPPTRLYWRTKFGARQRLTSCLSFLMVGIWSISLGGALILFLRFSF